MPATRTQDTASPKHVKDITPDDSNDLSNYSRAINVAVSGTVKVDTSGGTTATLYIAAGITFPVIATRIYATGTAATGIVALW